MPNQTTSKKQTVFNGMVEDITAGDISTSSALPPITRLANRFDTSVYTIHQALQMLDEEGYIERRNGVGCFVADSTPKVSFTDSIGVCMQPHAHLFGPLSRMIGSALHDRGLLSFMIDPSVGKGRDTLLSAARSGIRAFILPADMHFPFDVLESPHFDDASLVGVVKWQGPRLPNVNYVLSDGDMGGRTVASHLWRNGHRRILMGVTGTFGYALGRYRAGDDKFCRFPSADLAFVDEWERRGGELEYFTVSSQEESPYVQLDDETQYLAHFDADQPPTAIFGSFDVATLVAQRSLREHRPEMLEKVELMGYYDTPWSQAAHPPFSSVDLNLKTIARQATDMLDTIIAGEEVEESVQFVEPHLVKR